MNITLDWPYNTNQRIHTSLEYYTLFNIIKAEISQYPNLKI